MKNLKTFKELTESTSAGSQETNEVCPFRFSVVYDPRIGYNKGEFVSDLEIIIKKLSPSEKNELLSIIKGATGEASLNSIRGIKVIPLNELIHQVEEFISSKSDFKLRVYPDGFILCFENVVSGRTRFDIYYRPNSESIKIVPQTGASVEVERIIEIGKFSPIRFGISDEDFKRTIGRANDLAS